MSETAIESDVPAEPESVDPDFVEDSGEQPDTGEQQEQPAKDWEAEASKWRSMARKHEQTAKANSAAAAKYAEFEDSQKTEQQRLADRAEAAEQRAVAAEIRHARLVAAATHDIPLDLLDRLGGTTEDEINEAAEQLAAAFESEVGRRLAAVPVPEPEPEYEYERPARTRPVESLTPGALPAGEQPLDGNDYLRALAGRRN